MRNLFLHCCRILLSVLIVLAWGDSIPCGEGRRFALVIGNGSYAAGPLVNPVNDAEDMAKALAGVGFEVVLQTDADQRTMEKAIRQFGRRLKSGGVGLFYFAGHGLQVDGRNYLIPLGAHIEGASDLRYEAVDAGFVLGKMEDAENGLNIVILDACRDNPFARSFRSGEKGLAKMDAPVGSLLAYATAPGAVAGDGAGRNGLYTSQLLRHLSEPGLKIEALFKQVRRDVMDKSGNAQVPWESSSLTGEFCFAAAFPAAPAAPGPSKDETDRLAVLTAERARLEAERDRLAAEKALMAEKQRIEAEKSRVAAEKQRIEAEKLKVQLEMERLKAEQARMAAERRLAAAETGPAPDGTALASLPPKTGIDSSDKTPIPLKLALLVDSDSLNADSRTGGRGVEYRTRNLADFTVDFFMDRRDVVFAFSALSRGYFQKEEWVRRNVTIIEETSGDNSSQGLWSRPSLISGWQPDPERVLALGRRLGVDLVLLYRFSLGAFDGNCQLRIFLMDVARGKMHQTGRMMTGYRFSSKNLAPLLQKVLQPVLTAPSGETGIG